MTLVQEGAQKTVIEQQLMLHAEMRWNLQYKTSAHTEST
jgi:hypothetical protein